MDVREKLDKLLGKWLGHLSLAAANDLIANGVTFAKDDNVPSKWMTSELALAFERAKDPLPRFLMKENGDIVPLTNCQQWISVKERLPDRNDMVIAFYPTMRGTGGEMQIHKAWAMSETCTHWMPLPEPPEGE